MNLLPHFLMHFYLFFNLIFQEYDVVLTVVAMVHVRSPELTRLIIGTFYLGHTHTHKIANLLLFL